MPKPSGDNPLTRDKLRLRGIDPPDPTTPTKGRIDAATEQLQAEADFFAGEIQPSGALEPIYGIKIEFSGPGFRARLGIKGERFAVEKLLADFHESFSNM